ncbi:MAG: hypothetical protein AAGF87_12895 [Bacteroidota bacterium]
MRISSSPLALCLYIGMVFLFWTSAGRSLQAQTLTLSEEISIRADTEYHLVGKLGGRSLLLQDRGTRFFISAYDRRMRESWEKEIELRGRNIKLIDMASTPQDFKLVYLYRDKGHIHLQVDRYDPAANIRDSITVADLGYSLNSPSYLSVQSEDRSKMLVILYNEQSRFTSFSIDLDSMRLMRRSLIQPEDFFFDNNFLQAEISNEGTSFVITEQNNFLSRRKEHKFEVYVMPADTAVSPGLSNIALGDSLTYDVSFRYDNLNKKLVGGGLFTERDFSRAEGYFYFDYDPLQPTVHSLRFEGFDQDLINSIEGGRRRNREGIEELAVRDLVLRRDGGVLMITERNRQFERRSAANQLQIVNSFNRPLVDYHYDEMLILSIHPGGELHWDKVLHKRQYSQDDGGVFSSFFLLRTPQRLRFLFNDEIRQENTVSEYVLDGYGESDRNSLFHTRDLDLRLRFRDGKQVAANELIIPSERRNKLRLVTMTYE